MTTLPKPNPGGPPVTIYIAGSSAELDRCREFIAAVRRIQWSDGAPVYAVTHDWVADVDGYGGRASAGLTAQQRWDAAVKCESGIVRADLVVVLAPALDKPSIGCWVGLGMAITECITTLLVIDDERTVFSTQVQEWAKTDADALAIIATPNWIASMFGQGDPT